MMIPVIAGPLDLTRERFIPLADVPSDPCAACGQGSEPRSRSLIARVPMVLCDDAAACRARWTAVGTTGGAAGSMAS